MSMAQRTIVYRADPKSESSGSVASRLRADGIEIIEEQPNMLLVTGAEHAISKALGDIQGWSARAETRTPPPSTREKVLKPPSR